MTAARKVEPKIDNEAHNVSIPILYSLTEDRCVKAKEKTLTQYTLEMTAATRERPERPPGTMHTFSYVYLLSLPSR